MRFMSLTMAGLVVSVMTATTAAAQDVRVNDDTIEIRGCVTTAATQLQMPFETLVWSRGGMLTAGTAAAAASIQPDTEALGSKVLYWLDDDDLTEHAGKMVEVRGELGDLEKGEIEIDRDGEFTEIRLELDGHEEKIRVPSSWLERPAVARASRDARRDDDREIQIATRKVDVKNVKVLGPCPAR